MNQKNVFTVIAVVLVLQSVVFFFWGDMLATRAFAGQSEDANLALNLLFELPTALFILVGLIAYASRNTPSVLWAFTVGFAVLLTVTLKHKFVDGIDVPIPAIVIQSLIFLLCGYLWLGKKTAGS